LGDILRAVLDILTLLWPFRVVMQWQRGVRYVCGRYWSTLGPGTYLNLPFFMSIHPVSAVKSTWGTPLQTITLRDGKALSFSAMATIRVVDPNLALNSVEEWPETTMETVSGVLADRLAEADVGDFEPQYKRRQKMIETLRAEVNKETLRHGVEVEAIRFNNFMIGVRVYRLLQDRATYSETTIGAL
jgi:regulator of protease activity HflC (stomatin/prohibitin superfamily)